MDPVILARVNGHRQRSKDHAQSAEDLKGLGGIREWEVVMRFYSALQLVDAYLEIKGTPPANQHSDRSQAFRKNTELSIGNGRSFNIAYKRLKEVSEDVRYQPLFVTNQGHLDQCRKDLDLVYAFLNPKLDKAVAPTAEVPRPGA